MNSGALPSVTDAVSIIRKQGNEEAADAALVLYDNQMVSHFCRQPFPISEDDFNRIHAECLQEALRLFQSQGIFLDEDLSFQETLTVSPNNTTIVRQCEIRNSGDCYQCLIIDL